VPSMPVMRRTVTSSGFESQPLRISPISLLIFHQPVPKNFRRSQKHDYLNKSLKLLAKEMPENPKMVFVETNFVTGQKTKKY